MNPKEFFMGTPDERAAQDTIEILKAKQARKGRGLTPTQRVDFEQAKQLTRRLSRRRFLAGAGGGALALLTSGAAFFVTNSDESEADTLKPDIGLQAPTADIPMASRIESLEEWRNLTAKDRIQALIGKKTPEIDGFDVLEETVIASADFYTSQVKGIAAEELVKNTMFTETDDEFVDVALKNGNLRLVEGGVSLEDAKKIFLASSTAITTQDRKVFVSKSAIKKAVEDGIATYQPTADYAKNSNLFLSVVNYDLFHEYGHVNESKKVENIPSETFTMGGDSLKIEYADGLNLEGAFSTTGHKKELRVDEALIDTQAYELCRRVGNKMIDLSANQYSYARSWTEQINQYGKISFDDLTRYNRGDLPISQLMLRWGSLITVPGANRDSETEEQKIRRGERIFIILGLVVDGLIDNVSGQKQISGELSSSYQIIQLTPATPASR